MKRSGKRGWLLGAVVLAAAMVIISEIALARPGGGPTLPMVINDDGGWCWFQDERAIFAGGKLWVGSVASGSHQLWRMGNVEIRALDPASGKINRFVLNHNLELDDHAAPSLLELPDGRILAVYTGHGIDRKIRSRVTLRPGDPAAWSGERVYKPPSPGNTSYSNLYRLAQENRIYNFYRGQGWDPNVIISDDDGASWRYAGQLVTGPGRPYVRYASDNRNTIHFVCTEQHPRDFDNSIHHGYLRGGRIFDSSGREVGTLESPPAPERLTRVFQGGPDNVAWPSDVSLDDQGRLYVVYSVQKDGAGKPPRHGGMDHRYRYAWFDGSWHDYEVAFAGSRLYAGEDDYTGLISLHPQSPNTVYFSADVDPRTGEPLISSSDGKRHYEIFKGTTTDRGASWEFEAVTRDSAMDNIRPNVPLAGPEGSALLWLRGKMTTYINYDLEMVALTPAP